MRTITLEVHDTVYSLLEVLAEGGMTVEDVVGLLIDHAQQGVYRPGSWERHWLMQAFGDTWIKGLEPGDPHGRAGCEGIFERPRKKS
jgi:hypothetical protein